MHSLWLRCAPTVAPVSGKRAGLPVAERVLSAELRGKKINLLSPEYRCLISSACRFSSALSRSIFGLFSGKKNNLEVDFLDRGGKKNLVSDCLQLPPSYQQQQYRQIDLFLHIFKNNASYVSSVY